MKLLVAPLLLTAMVGCQTMAQQPSIQARRIGSFEVGRMPGDMVGAYGALTTNANNAVFARVCTIGACRWMLFDSQNSCIPSKSYSTTLSVGNVAYRQDMVCVDGSGGRVFESDDREITKLIVQSNQIGITPPVGPAAVFDVTGAADAVAYLDKR